MISALKNMFSQSATSGNNQDREHSLRLACAVVMLEVVRADMQAHPAEIAVIQQHMKTAFALSDDESELLLSRARDNSENSVSLHEVIREINTSCSADEKRYLIKLLWDIAFADGNLDPYEEHAIRKMADWLYVPHREFIMTKHESSPKEQA